eukprot:4398150-Pleurochrysis_carterae.AAC.1
MMKHCDGDDGGIVLVNLLMISIAIPQSIDEACSTYRISTVTGAMAPAAGEEAGCGASAARSWARRGAHALILLLCAVPAASQNDAPSDALADVQRAANGGPLHSASDAPSAPWTQQIELRAADPCVLLLNATGAHGCATRNDGTIAPLLPLFEQACPRLRPLPSLVSA